MSGRGAGVLILEAEPLGDETKTGSKGSEVRMDVAGVGAFDSSPKLLVVRRQLRCFILLKCQNSGRHRFVNLPLSFCPNRWAIAKIGG